MGNYSPNDPNWGKPDPNPGRDEALFQMVQHLVRQEVATALKDFRCDHHCPRSTVIG